MTLAIARGLNPLAISMGKKLKGIRISRGITQAEAAKQLGLGLQLYSQLEAGNFLPVYWIQERLVGWALRGETFTHKEERGVSEILRAPVLRSVQLRLPEQVAQRLSAVCGSLGISQYVFVAVAVERLLDSPSELLAYDEAARRLRRAYVMEALQSEPELRKFLQCDLEYAKDMGAVLHEQKPAHTPASPVVEQLVNNETIPEYVDAWEVVE